MFWKKNAVATNVLAEGTTGLPGVGSTPELKKKEKKLSKKDIIVNQLEALQMAIAPNVRDIHAFWLARRNENPLGSQPMRRSEPRVGRNDPCPCGSGKKYKKCCLH